MLPDAVLFLTALPLHVSS